MSRNRMETQIESRMIQVSIMILVEERGSKNQILTSLLVKFMFELVIVLPHVLCFVIFFKENYRVNLHLLL